MRIFVEMAIYTFILEYQLKFSNQIKIKFEDVGK